MFYFFNKKELKALLQEIFDVKVVSINTYILPGKKRRLGKFEGFKTSYKRVFVTLLGLLLFLFLFSSSVYFFLILLSVFYSLKK